MKFIEKLRSLDRSTVIKNSFLLPILSVVAMSISHVISWYDLGNPFSWAIYLSIAVEVFALASVSAASIKMKKGSIWLLFCLVTAIQIIGNVFFTYQDINTTGSTFKSWVELVQPWFEDWTPIDHRRFLALIQGGTLPFMSLIALHFYIKFNENLKEGNSGNPKDDIAPVIEPIAPVIEEPLVEEEVEEEVVEEIKEEPLVTSEAEDEKKTNTDQIHISDNLEGRRRRLHPSRY